MIYNSGSDEDENDKSSEDDHSVMVSCREGFDGGFGNQSFHVEVYDYPDDHLIVNLTKLDSPKFLIKGLKKSHDYMLVIYSTNQMGKSQNILMKYSHNNQILNHNTMKISGSSSSSSSSTADGHQDSQMKFKNVPNDSTSSGSKSSSSSDSNPLQTSSSSHSSSSSDKSSSTPSSSPSSSSSTFLGMSLMTFIGIIFGILFVLVVLGSITSFILVRKIQSAESRYSPSDQDHQDPDDQDDHRIHNSHDHLTATDTMCSSSGKLTSSIDSSTGQEQMMPSSNVKLSTIKSSSLSTRGSSRSSSSSRKRQPMAVTFANNSCTIGHTDGDDYQRVSKHQTNTISRTSPHKTSLMMDHLNPIHLTHQQSSSTASSSPVSSLLMTSSSHGGPCPDLIPPFNTMFTHHQHHDLSSNDSFQLNPLCVDLVHHHHNSSIDTQDSSMSGQDAISLMMNHHQQHHPMILMKTTESDAETLLASECYFHHHLNQNSEESQLPSSMFGDADGDNSIGGGSSTDGSNLTPQPPPLLYNRSAGGGITFHSASPSSKLHHNHHLVPNYQHVYQNLPDARMQHHLQHTLSRNHFMQPHHHQMTVSGSVASQNSDDVNSMTSSTDGTHDSAASACGISPSSIQQLMTHHHQLSLHEQSAVAYHHQQHPISMNQDSSGLHTLNSYSRHHSNHQTMGCSPILVSKGTTTGSSLDAGDADHPAHLHQHRHPNDQMGCNPASDDRQEISITSSSVNFYSKKASGTGDDDQQRGPEMEASSITASDQHHQGSSSTQSNNQSHGAGVNSADYSKFMVSQFSQSSCLPQLPQDLSSLFE